jgi:hypothetical protein
MKTKNEFRRLIFMNIIIFASLACLFSPSVKTFAQNAEKEVLYYENRVASAIASFRDLHSRPHFLGEEVGRKYSVFSDLYSYTVSSQMMQTGQQVVVDKPIIFNAVKKTNRYYRQLLKKHQITEEEARNKVNHMLDVAISVYTQSTEALESRLKSTRKQDEIAAIFEQVVLR